MHLCQSVSISPKHKEEKLLPCTFDANLTPLKKVIVKEGKWLQRLVVLLPEAIDPTSNQSTLDCH